MQRNVKKSKSILAQYEKSLNQPLTHRGDMNFLKAGMLARKKLKKAGYTYSEQNKLLGLE